MPRLALEHALRDPGFTPSLRDVGAIVELLADDALTKFAERAILRAGAPALQILCERFQSASPPLRPRLLRAIGLFAAAPAARTLLIAALDDGDAKTRRNAAIALGRSPGEGVEGALLRAWDRDPRPEMRRSIAASLGKVGSPQALALLRDSVATGDDDLARIAERAVLMIERTASRATRGRIVPERIPSSPLEVEALARRGIEGLLADELAGVSGVSNASIAGPGRVRAVLAGSMNAMFAARTMLSFRFPLFSAPLQTGETIEEATARVIGADAARQILMTFTLGAARYRIAWAEKGHRRALTWSTARSIARRVPELVNDPTSSLWEVTVASEPTFGVALSPRALADPRFAWRKRDVPAASHPTIAAALARVARVTKNDVVWDPFVGSGAELVECALSGRGASLFGSDVDARALDAARENLGAAGVRAHLELADARGYAPRGVTVIVTNPPMGRRASRTAELAAMLDGFVERVATLLPAGGRFVWISPAPKRARLVGLRSGLSLDWAQTVDMGGFDGEMQRWIKRD